MARPAANNQVRHIVHRLSVCLSVCFAFALHAEAARREHNSNNNNDGDGDSAGPKVVKKLAAAAELACQTSPLGCGKAKTTTTTTKTNANAKADSSTEAGCRLSEGNLAADCNCSRLECRRRLCAKCRLCCQKVGPSPEAVACRSKSVADSAGCSHVCAGRSCNCLAATVAQKAFAGRQQQVVSPARRPVSFN